MKKIDIANKWFLAVFTIVIVGVIIAFLSVLFVKTSDDSEDVTDGDIHLPEAGDLVFEFEGAKNVKVVVYHDTEVMPSPGEGEPPQKKNIVTYEIQRGYYIFSFFKNYCVYVSGDSD